jgi:phosphoenolpyruvate carboxylase
MSTASLVEELQARPIAAVDQPLVEDTQLLGRVLSEVIRNEEVTEAYALIEQIRALSVASRRRADNAADYTLKKLPSTLLGEEAVTAIPVFTCFSHLANLAEDWHYIP